ncbi:hypothetical protein HYW39_00025 [Candidatus Curtissbacteria bacterium]|nr:hypothetical protein [Candidatus Curtissbacteria bacterium]
MPFKTKRQKIKAAQRRFTFLEGGLINYHKTSQKVEGITTKKEAAVSGAIEANYQYVKNDLVRIILFAALVVIGQISLKFGLLSILQIP